MKKRFKDLPDNVYYRFEEIVPNNFLKLHGYVMERKKSFGTYGRLVLPFRLIEK